jgi:hypothetical protein
MDKQLQREKEHYEYITRCNNFKTKVASSEKYVKGQGYLSRAEITKLVRDGYTIKRGKIIKISKKFR